MPPSFAPIPARSYLPLLLNLRAFLCVYGHHRAARADGVLGPRVFPQEGTPQLVTKGGPAWWC